MERITNLPIRLRQAERLDLERAAAENGMTLSGFIRDAAVGVAQALLAKPAVTVARQEDQ